MNLNELASKLWPFLARLFCEVGTFTPSFTGSGTAGSFTYSGRTGRYIRIFNYYWYSIYLEVSAIAVAPTSDLNITGMPFTSANVVQGASIGYLNSFNLTAGRSFLTAYAEASSTLIRLMEAGDNVAASRFPAASFQVSGIIVSGFCEIA
jgi:hypothetical protein